MKKFALFAVALSAMAPAAFAYAPDALTPAERSAASQYVPSADLSNLTTAQVQAISSVLGGSDNNTGAQIRSILNW